MGKRKTHEEYVLEVSKVNNNIEVIGQYVNSNTKILHKCKLDSHEWDQKPYHILAGHGCPKCANRIKPTQEEYILKVKSINPNIEVLEIYVNSFTKIAHKCLIDGHEWNARPADILSGYGCPECAGNKRYTHEEYVEKVKNISSDIEVLEKYINIDTPIWHKCKIDKHRWRAIPYHVLNGTGCPKCAKNAKRTPEEYVNLMHTINPDVEILGTYVNAHTKIIHKCKIHNFEWDAEPNKMINGAKCPICSHSIIGPAPNYLNSIWASEYKDYFSKFMTENEMKQYMPRSEKTLDIKCPRCGFLKNISPDALFAHGFGCPKCSDGLSYPNKFGRAFIEQFDVNNIVFEYSPEWLIVNNNKCAYDIYFEYYGKKYVIEMDGGIGHGNFTYKNNKIRDTDGLKKDQEKDKLAKLNNVQVIRIDCTTSDCDYIKMNIMKSVLPQILKFKEDDVNWNACDEVATASYILKAGELWNNGLMIKEIAASLKINVNTVTRYLKKCAKLGRCNYSTTIVRKRQGTHFSGIHNPKSKKVIRLCDLKIYDSMKESSLDNGISLSTMQERCKHHIDFMYYDDWLSLNN